MRRMKTLITAIVATVIVVLGFSACSAGTSAPATGAKAENSARLSTYDQLVKNQPAHTGTYSPTRATKNFWIDTWMKTPNKLAYIYMQNSTGQVYGYYITVGLPVSYCTGLVPPYTFVRTDGGEYNQDTEVPAPSVDGTYSSASNCNEFYGKDAVSGAYIEYFAGLGNNPMISDQPLPQYGDAQPLAKATVAGVKAK